MNYNYLRIQNEFIEITDFIASFMHKCDTHHLRNCFVFERSIHDIVRNNNYIPPIFNSYINFLTYFYVELGIFYNYCTSVVYNPR